MSIEFQCSECGTIAEVDDDLAGKRIKCRECHGLGRVPKKPALAEEIPQRVIATPAPRTKGIQMKGWLPRSRWFWISAGALIALVVLPVCLFLAFSVVAHFDRASKRTPSKTDLNAMLLAQEGEWKKAFSVIDTAITDEPDRVSHWMTRAALKMKYGSYGPAVQDYETVLRLDSGYDEAKRLLAEASQKTKKARNDERKQELEKDLQQSQEFVQMDGERLRDVEQQFRLYEGQLSPEGRDTWTKLVRDAKEQFRGAQEKVQNIQKELQDLKRDASSP